jgi:hypothetical protein
MNKLKSLYEIDRYTRNDYIVYLFSMLPSSATNLNPKPKPVSSRKKSSAKLDDTDKITEKVEGGIIVRRYKGRKVDPEGK